MRHAIARSAQTVVCCLVAFVPAIAGAAMGTKVEEGFATRLKEDGSAPANRVGTAEIGHDIYYFIRWKDNPGGAVTFRCVVRFDPNGPPLIDEEETVDDADAEGYSTCGLGTDRDTEEGTYFFAQYVDGRKVGEQSIALAKPLKRTNLMKQFKYYLGLLAGGILAAAWVIRKWRARDEKDTDTPRGVRGVVIGENVDPAYALAAQEAQAAAQAKSDETQELRKCGNRFQALLAQPGKSGALDEGRRYLGLLLKARNEAEALKVFKECAAVDAAFRPAQGEHVLPIAKAARAAGDPQAAVAALRGFDKAYPDHAAIPDVYLFSAKLMAEDLHNPEMARRILDHVLKRYPGHYVAQEARKYLQGLPAPA